MNEDLRRVEAYLFVHAGTTISLDEIARATDIEDVRGCIDRLRHDYRERALLISVTEDGCTLRTKPEHSETLRQFKGRRKPLGRAASQTLAVIAIYGPCTRSEIERYRGVSLSSGTLEQVVDAGYVIPGPRRETPGRPMTWTVTQDYLDAFNLAQSDIADIRKQVMGQGLPVVEDNTAIPGENEDMALRS